MALTTRIFYLERLEVYQKVKPYIIAYDTSEGVGPKTNNSYQPHEVTIEDVQLRRHEFSTDVHGFQFAQWETSMSSEEFDKDQLVESKYYPEIINHLQQLSPECLEVHVLTHLLYELVRVRKQHGDLRQRRKQGPNFLKRTETDSRFLAPILFAHTDYSPKGSVIAIKQILENNPHLRGYKYDLVNVWRPTKGPNKGWPLGLCDYRTIEPDDIEFNDVVHKSHLGESMRLYANSKHRWYFLDNQTTDQVAIFRNIHSDGLKKPFGAHLSFPMPQPGKSQDSFPRESIEIRLVRFFK